jgi:hypothetical protein
MKFRGVPEPISAPFWEPLGGSELTTFYNVFEFFFCFRAHALKFFPYLLKHVRVPLNEVMSVMA